MAENEIKQLKISDLYIFEGTPFLARNEEEQTQLMESIKNYGIFEPILVRLNESGKYEVVSGQRRLEAAQQAGLTEVPVIVRNMSRHEAIIALVDSNIHREHLLPSERAKAYLMKLEAIKHQGDHGGHDVHKLGVKSRDVIAENAPDGARQIQRYIRLNFLVKSLLDMVDAGLIGLTPAVQLSYLKPDEQNAVADAIERMDATPNLSQAMRLRQISETEGLKTIKARMIMAEAKANQREYLRLPMSSIRRYFPKDYTDQQIGDTIIKLLDTVAQRNHNRKHELEK